MSALSHQLVITAYCEESSCFLRAYHAGRKAIMNLVPDQGHLVLGELDLLDELVAPQA
jgi:hypothetical protein